VKETSLLIDVPRTAKTTIYDGGNQPTITLMDSGWAFPVGVLMRKRFPLPNGE